MWKQCLSVSAVVLAASAAAQTDTTIFTQISESFAPRSVSVYLLLEGPRAENLDVPKNGRENHRYTEVWERLYLHVYGQTHTAIRSGVHGYHFALSRDSAGEKNILATNQPGHGITAETVSAFHFRNSDNSGPNDVGPKNVNAPGALRAITYKGLKMTIRILEFTIINGAPGEIPSFASMSCLVTVSESAGAKTG